MDATAGDQIGQTVWIGENPETGAPMPCMLVYPVEPPDSDDEVRISRKLETVITRGWGVPLGPRLHTSPPVPDTGWVIHQGGLVRAGLGPIDLVVDVPEWTAVLRRAEYACVCVTTRAQPALLPPEGAELWLEYDAEVVEQGVSMLVPLWGAPLPDSALPSPTSRRSASGRPGPGSAAIRRAARVRGEVPGASMADGYSVAHPSTGMEPGDLSAIAGERMLADLTGITPKAGVCWSCGLPDEDGTHVC